MAGGGGAPAAAAAVAVRKTLPRLLACSAAHTSYSSRGCMHGVTVQSNATGVKRTSLGETMTSQGAGA